MSSYEQQAPKPETQELPSETKAKFQVSCLARIDELVAQGIFPQKYADERKAAAKKIEDGLTDPEAQGVAFAEVGMDAIQQFRETVDDAEAEVGTKVEAAVGQLDKLQATLLARKIVPIDIKVRLAAIDVAREEIISYLDDFRLQLRSVRDLQTKISVATADDTLQSIMDRVSEEEK